MTSVRSDESGCPTLVGREVSDHAHPFLNMRSSHERAPRGELSSQWRDRFSLTDHSHVEQGKQDESTFPAHMHHCAKPGETPFCSTAVSCCLAGTVGGTGEH